jgi:hypothetical protein
VVRQYLFVLGSEFGRLAAFLMQSIVFPLQKNRCHFSNVAGFTPVQPLKKNRFGIFRLFSPSHAVMIAFLGY